MHTSSPSSGAVVTERDDASRRRNAIATAIGLGVAAVMIYGGFILLVYLRG